MQRQPSALEMPADTPGASASAVRGMTGRAGRSQSTWLVAGVAVVGLAMGLLSAYWLWVLRDHRLQFTRHQVQLQTRAVAEHARAVYGGADATLLGLVADLRVGRLAPQAASSNLRLRLGGPGGPLRALTLIDADGRALASSWSDPPPPVQAALPDDEPDLRLAGPHPNAYDGRMSIVLTRGVPGHGVVAAVSAVVDTQFIVDFFSRVAYADDARLGLYALDGRRLAGDLPLPSSNGGPLDPPQRLRALLDATRDGTAETPDEFIAAQRLDGLPMAVVTVRERDAVLAPWRNYLAGALVANALGLSLLAFVATRLSQERRARLAAQAALDRTRENARLAFEAAEEGTWFWDPAHSRVELSPRMAALLGTDVSRVDLDFFSGPAVHPDDRQVVAQALATHLEGSRPQVAAQFRVPDAAGGWRWVHVRGRLSRDAGGRLVAVVGTASDETEARARGEQLQALQTQLQRTFRLESLGRLSGGIAHDFNNVLAAVIGFGEVLQDQLPSGSAAARQVDQILRAGERGRSLVARILSFSRGAARTLVPVHAEAVVAEAAKLLAAAAPANVDVALHLGAGSAQVRGDASQLFEAVTNLCSNALAAMPQGGRLDVRTRRETVEPGAGTAVSHGRLQAGEHLALEVADTGVGMAAEVMEHLFEPFFTTRGGAGGTGLGLAMVHGMVTEMHGAIDVASVPGRGSRFTLWLPIVAASVSSPEPAESATGRGAGQVVMVVDDEAPLVALAEEVLAGLGYEPVGYTDAASALATLRQSPDRFDVLLTDELMPGMRGTELARHWRALRGEAPVLLASGYGGPDLEREARAAGVRAVLQKPVCRAELAARLAEALAPAG